MKNRIFSIMDMNKKKTGLFVVCAVLIITAGTSFVFGSNFSATQVDNSVDENNSGYGSNFILSSDTIETFSVYAEFGLTYDHDNMFRYKGKTVRRFVDLSGAVAFTRDVENDYNKSVDLTAVRDENKKLIDIIPSDKQQFDQRTAQIELAQKEQAEFYKTHPNTVTAYSESYTNTAKASNTVNSLAVTSVSENYGAKSSSSSQDPDYIDTSLNAYINYGVSYDKLTKTWKFNQKRVAFLYDKDRHIFSGFSYDNTADDFADKVEASDEVFLKVVRKWNGLIDKIVEMDTDETVSVITDIFNK